MNPVVLLVIYRMVDIQLLAILVRTVHTVQQTGDFHRYSSWYGCHALLLCNDRCPSWSAQKLWSSAVAVLMVAVQFLDKVVVPVGATTLGRAILVRLWIYVLHHPGRLLEELVQFST